MMTAPSCGRDDANRRAFQETVVWSPTPFNPSKLSLQKVTPLKGLGQRDEIFLMERCYVKIMQLTCSKILLETF